MLHVCWADRLATEGVKITFVYNLNASPVYRTAGHRVGVITDKAVHFDGVKISTGPTQDVQRHQTESANSQIEVISNSIVVTTDNTKTSRKSHDLSSKYNIPVKDLAHVHDV